MKEPVEDFGCQRIHARKGEAFFAEVFEGCADVVEGLAVEDEKAVVKMSNGPHLHGWILVVVLLNIQSELVADFFLCRSSP